MRQSLYVIVALVAGLVIGQLSVRPDLRRARAEIASLQEQLRRRGQRESGLPNITAMLRLPELAASASSTPAVESAETTSDSELAAPQEAPRRDAASFSNEIQTAVELWQTRSALARTALLDRLNASPVQAQLFDQVVTNMNVELAAKIRTWADYLREQPEVTAEVGLRMLTDLGATVVAGYDQMDELFGPDWRTAAGRQFQLLDFIQPSVVLPLVEVEGISAGRGRRRER